MVTATMILDLFSGLTVWATGVYVLVEFVELLPVEVRVLLVAAAGSYFGWQLYRYTPESQHHGAVRQGRRVSPI